MVASSRGPMLMGRDSKGPASLPVLAFLTVCALRLCESSLNDERTPRLSTVINTHDSSIGNPIPILCVCVGCPSESATP